MIVFFTESSAFAFCNQTKRLVDVTHKLHAEENLENLQGEAWRCTKTLQGGFVRKERVFTMRRSTKKVVRLTHWY